jgi:hypothetical protein
MDEARNLATLFKSSRKASPYAGQRTAVDAICTVGLQSLTEKRIKQKNPRTRDYSITQQVRKAFVSSHRDRGRQKRDFRHLWITQINAATQVYNIFNSYSKLIRN